MTIIFASYNKVPKASRLDPFSSFTSVRKEFCCIECTPDLKPKKTVVNKALPHFSNRGKITAEGLHKIPTEETTSICQRCGEYCLNLEQCRLKVETLKRQQELTAMRRKMYNRPKKQGKNKLRKEKMARGQKKNKWVNSKIKKKMLNKCGDSFSCCGGPWDKVDAARSSRRKKKVKASKWRSTLLDFVPKDSVPRKLGYAIKSDYCDALRRPIHVGF